MDEESLSNQASRASQIICGVTPSSNSTTVQISNIDAENIIFDLGHNYAGNVTDVPSENNGSYILCVPKRIGYRFDGWYADSNFSGNAVTSPEANKTYYAKWEECTDHRWEDATCTTPETCLLCGKTDGDALGHSFTNAGLIVFPIFFDCF